MSGIEDDENVALEGDAGGDDQPDEAELELVKQRMKEMEEEAAKLKEMQSGLEKEMGKTEQSTEPKEDIDARSIYVGSVEYGATPEELQSHFQSCGTINRVTIMCDKATGQPKGFAYVEFADKESVVNAMVLNDSLFRGRQLKVSAKRTNIPGLAHRGRGRGRGGFNNPMAMMAAMMGMGGRFRGPPRFRNRRAHYKPY